MAGRIEAKHGRSTQEMTAISGALTLLTNAVMAWNAEQMQRVVTDGGPTRYPAAHMARHAPVDYKQINTKGVMRFRLADTRPPGRLDRTTAVSGKRDEGSVDQD